MTERERWIVYPLLVLALGASLRDKFGGPATLDATQIRCDEIRATKFTIVEPQNNQPRIVLGTVQEPAQSGAGGRHTAGQIELLDHAQRPQTVIQHGVVHSPGLRTQAIAVIDAKGLPRVHIGSKQNGVAAAKSAAAPTSGFVEVHGEHVVPVPAVRLAATSDGGYVFTRREGLPLGVALGNFPPGSGTYLQVGERLVPLAGSIGEPEIKKIAELAQQAGEKEKNVGPGQRIKPDSQGSGTRPAAQPTGPEKTSTP